MQAPQQMLMLMPQAAISITGLVSMIKNSEYVPLKEDLIVVEVTPEGIPIEKRVAKEADFALLHNSVGF